MKVLAVVAMFVAQPSFVVTPQDKVVGVGRRVSLRCQVTGNPVPAVFWNKQSSQVFNAFIVSFTVCISTLSSRCMSESNSCLCK